MELKPFIYHENHPYNSGWDQYALDYAALLKPGSLYSLTKKLAHQIVEYHIPDGTGKKVLDLNCGTGNDFPYFLEQGYQITGTDGSSAMLNKAYEIYEKHLKSGRIRLHQIMMQKLSAASFPENSFDLIYSITGGYAYIRDIEFLEVNQLMARYLKPGGFLITGHLTPFCLGESLYYLKKAKIKRAFKRLQTSFYVPIKGERHRMYLRSVRRLKQLTTDGLTRISCHPLITTTPPYQTYHQPSSGKLDRYASIEQKRLFHSRYTGIADQVVIVEQRQ